MRNFSMKKFGTPTGAGPGRAKEKVGFDGVGAPPRSRAGAGVSRFSSAALVPRLPSMTAVVSSLVVFERSRSGRDLEDSVVVVVAGVVDAGADEVGAAWSVVAGACCCAGSGCGAGLTSTGDVAGAGGLASETPMIGPWTPGIWIWSSGVPGGTST